MIAVDTNVLVQAHRSDSTRHEAAFNAIRGLAEGIAPWALPWACLHEFFSIVTHPRIFNQPSTPAQALDQISEWARSPSVKLLTEGARHVQVLTDLVQGADIRGPRIHVARVAAVCLDHGVTLLWTADRDFSRFPQLQTSNPLSP